MSEDGMRKYVAELFGTFAMVMIGVGSAVLAGSKIGNLGVALAFGLVLLAMVYAIGTVSGCHINPAVTVGVLAAGKMPVREAIIYIVVQCFGAMIGAGVVLAVAMGNPDYSLAVNGLGQNGYGALSPGGFSLAAAFIAEVVMMLLFVFVILAVTGIAELKSFTALPIGLALTMVHLVLIPVTNASVNPARSLGPAIFVGGEALTQLWLFWVAPIIGAVLAALLWRYILAPGGASPVAVAEAAQA